MERGKKKENNTECKTGRWCVSKWNLFINVCNIQCGNAAKRFASNTHRNCANICELKLDEMNGYGTLSKCTWVGSFRAIAIKRARWQFRLDRLEQIYPIAHTHTHSAPSRIGDGAVLRVFNLNILWRASGTFSFGEATRKFISLLVPKKKKKTTNEWTKNCEGGKKSQA